MRIFTPYLENSLCPVSTRLFHLALHMALVPWPVLLWYRHKPSFRCGLLLKDSSPTNENASDLSESEIKTKQRP